MTIAQSLILGILQGLTEFLPISSSGHLALAETFMGLTIDPRSLLGFDVLLHAGTLVALLFVYRQAWWRILTSLTRKDKQHQWLLLLLILATVPGALVGFLFADVIALQLRTSLFVGIAFAITAVVLVVAERFPSHRRMHHLRPLDVLLIGLAQAFALVPGLSRSGLTISAGRALSVDRREALDFSFLMLVPITAGATVLTLRDFASGTVLFPPPSVMLTGFAASLVVSVLAILFLRYWVISRSLAWFALYLLPASLFLVFGT